MCDTSPTTLGIPLGVTPLIPPWVYLPYMPPLASLGVYIQLYASHSLPGCVYTVYMPPIASLGVYTGVYASHSLPGCVQWCTCLPDLSPTPVSLLVLYSLQPLGHPFHCWFCTLFSLLKTRFTVGFVLPSASPGPVSLLVLYSLLASQNRRKRGICAILASQNGKKEGNMRHSSLPERREKRRNSPF